MHYLNQWINSCSKDKFIFLKYWNANKNWFHTHALIFFNVWFLLSNPAYFVLSAPQSLLFSILFLRQPIHFLLNLKSSQQLLPSCHDVECNADLWDPGRNSYKSWANSDAIPFATAESIFSSGEWVAVSLLILNPSSYVEKLTLTVPLIVSQDPCP